MNTNFVNVLTAVGGKYLRKDSYVEAQIKDILNNLNVKYKQEKLITVPIWGKDHLIRADFYLPKQNCIIEFNGKQHYEYMPKYHKSEGSFKYQQERDAELEKYCLKNNINLMVFRYEDFKSGKMKRDITNMVKMQGKMGVIDFPEIL
jgi:hypothetical protein